MSALAATEVEALADALWSAQRDGVPAPAPSAAVPGLDLDGAYAVQRALVDRHRAAGETPIGWKVGRASAAGRTPRTPGPVYGRLLSGMVVRSGATLEAAGLHGAHVEGEIAVVLRGPLRGPGVSVADVLDAIEAVLPAIEVFARRIEEAEATAVVDSVADNASSAHVVLGERRLLNGLDLRLTGLVLTRNGEIAGTGAGAQVLGHPAAAVAWLANALAEHGEQLRAGEVVLTGALAGAHPPAAGDRFVAELDRLGSVSVRFA